MKPDTTMQTCDWGEITALADDGSHPPSVAYEFSNGRKFYRSIVTKTPSNHEQPPDPTAESAPTG
ncbi:MAG: hypothetical protein HQL77_13935 [Magnetococcales bacterium]|nr:hypothetical protein [Magnetococcales bacterium]MBF0415946.1 hypothetical protein [Magnetococcales bacterium]MBF0436460.1 hypothetical protein [Magnetococcales bacterium]